MYTVVEFEIATAPCQRFMTAVLKQTRRSLELEREGHQFDVCIHVDAPQRVLLYERYGDRADLTRHLASAHFLEFDQRVADWTLEKTVTFWQGQA